MTSEEYGQAHGRGFDLTVRFLLSCGTYPGDRAADVAQKGWSIGWEKLGQLRDPRLLIHVYRRCVRRESRFRILPEVNAKASIDMAAN
jgi:hypothetical protein